MAIDKKNLGMESHHQTILKNRGACNELLARLRSAEERKKRRKKRGISAQHRQKCICGKFSNANA